MLRYGVFLLHNYFICTLSLAPLQAAAIHWQLYSHKQRERERKNMHIHKKKDKQIKCMLVSIYSLLSLIFFFFFLVICSPTGGFCLSWVMRKLILWITRCLWNTFIYNIFFNVILLEICMNEWLMFVNYSCSMFAIHFGYENWKKNQNFSSCHRIHNSEWAQITIN